MIGQNEDRTTEFNVKNIVRITYFRFYKFFCVKQCFLQKLPYFTFQPVLYNFDFRLWAQFPRNVSRIEKCWNIFPPLCSHVSPFTPPAIRSFDCFKNYFNWCGPMTELFGEAGEERQRAIIYAGVSFVCALCHFHTMPEPVPGAKCAASEQRSVSERWAERVEEWSDGEPPFQEQRPSPTPWWMLYARCVQTFRFKFLLDN